EYSSKSFSSSSSQSSDTLSAFGGEGQGEVAALNLEPETLNSRSAGGFRRKYLEQELLEVSAVGIPANPNALALGLKSGAIHKSDVRDLADLIQQKAEALRDLEAVA